jgi:hypothetical protein
MLSLHHETNPFGAASAMRKPLLLTTIFTAILSVITQAQPQSSPEAAATMMAASGGATGTSTAVTHFDGKVWWNYVKILAADDMEGRETGSPGLRKAQEYVVEQLKRAGLLQNFLSADSACVAPDRGKRFEHGPGP